MMTIEHRVIENRKGYRIELFLNGEFAAAIIRGVLTGQWYWQLVGGRTQRARSLPAALSAAVVAARAIGQGKLPSLPLH